MNDDKNNAGRPNPTPLTPPLPISQQMPLISSVLLGIYLAVLAFLELALIIVLWPESTIIKAADLTMEQRLFVLVIISGAAGTTLMLIVYYVTLAAGQRLLNKSGWWFGLPPLIGALAGFIVYLGVRGGILKLNQSVDALNPYTICALAAFAGLQWRQIVGRLQSLLEGRSFE